MHADDNDMTRGRRVKRHDGVKSEMEMEMEMAAVTIYASHAVPWF